MFKDIYEKRWVHWGARILGVIPISSEQHPRELIQSLQTASDAIRNGEVVCIFAEGQITRIGQLLPFRRGMERIMKGRGRAHRAGGARRRDGQHFQLRTSPLRLEMAAQNPASGHRQLRRAAAADRNTVRNAAGRAGTSRVRLAASPRPDETVAPPVRAGRRGNFRCGLRWPMRRTKRSPSARRW